MKNRFGLSIVMATVGACLLMVSAFAGGARSAPQVTAKVEARGGTFIYDSRSDFDYIDPQLAYFSHSWNMMNATNLHLLTYPDKEGAAGQRLVPEAAAGMPTVSRDGKTYTFRIKPGFKFSNGAAVTAANFAFAMNRGLSPKLNASAAQFMTDIVGAQAVLDGKAATASGIKANGMTLSVTLKNVAPDFLARMTMEFFPAMPTNLPLNETITKPYPTAGPYILREWTPNRSAVLVRNPQWKHNAQPWKALGRPANVDSIQYVVGNTEEATKLRVDKGEADYGGIPPAAVQELVQKYGLNKSRFFLRKEMTLWYIALNTESTLFKGNAKLRQAVNHAVDRPALVRQFGYLGGARTDQVLPPGMPGYRDYQIYSLGGINQAALNRANALASGNKRDGKATFYAFNSTTGRGLAQIVQYNLGRIGVDVNIQAFDRVVQHEKVATRGEPFDLTIEGWGADYPDPSNFINVLLDGSRIQPTHNQNVSYFNNPTYNKRMADAYKLSGDQRLRTYAELDRDIVKNESPVAPFIDRNARFYVSENVGCFSVSPTRATIHLTVICKK